MSYGVGFYQMIKLHLVLFLMPPPHVREQDVHDPHGPTLQSTENKQITTAFKKGVTTLILFFHTR